MPLIRSIIATDCEGYHLCLDLVCQEGRYLESSRAPSLETSRALVQMQDGEHRLMFVAVAGEQVVGWCDITPQNHSQTWNRGQLGIGVHPQHRGRAIGGRLLRMTLDAGRQSGLEQVELEVRSDNDPALALYEQVGFAVTGTTPGAMKVGTAYYDTFSMALAFN